MRCPVHRSTSVTPWGDPRLCKHIHAQTHKCMGHPLCHGCSAQPCACAYVRVLCSRANVCAFPSHCCQRATHLNATIRFLILSPPKIRNRLSSRDRKNLYAHIIQRHSIVRHMQAQTRQLHCALRWSCCSSVVRLNVFRLTLLSQGLPVCLICLSAGCRYVVTRVSLCPPRADPPALPLRASQRL